MTAALVAGIFTVGALCVIEGYLLLGRFQYLANRADETADNSDQAIDRANAAVDRAAQAADKVDALVGKLWRAYEAYMPAAGPESEPTQPQPVVQPPTVPSHEAVTVQAVTATRPRDDEAGRVTDVELAHVLADMDNFVIDMEKRDAERKARAA